VKQLSMEVEESANRDEGGKIKLLDELQRHHILSSIVLLAPHLLWVLLIPPFLGKFSWWLFEPYQF
jgi:hypothetical protein